jgi:hypothetical protein
MIAACACKRTPELQEPARDLGPKPTTAVMTAPPEPLAPPSDASPCALKIPQNSEEVALFPTEAGLRAFSAASAGEGDEFKMATAMQSQHAFFVAARTPCVRLGVGQVGTKVRVSDGPHSNKEGWVASAWTKGN